MNKIFWAIDPYTLKDATFAYDSHSGKKMSYEAFNHLVGITHDEWDYYQATFQLAVSTATYKKIRLLAEHGYGEHTHTLFKIIDARYTSEAS